MKGAVIPALALAGILVVSSWTFLWEEQEATVKGVDPCLPPVEWEPRPPALHLWSGLSDYASYGILPFRFPLLVPTRIPIGLSLVGIFTFSESGIGSPLPNSEADSAMRILMWGTYRVIFVYMPRGLSEEEIGHPYYKLLERAVEQGGFWLKEEVVELFHADSWRSVSYPSDSEWTVIDLYYRKWITSMLLEQSNIAWHIPMDAAPLGSNLTHFERILVDGRPGLLVGFRGGRTGCDGRLIDESTLVTWASDGGIYTLRSGFDARRTLDVARSTVLL